VKVIILAICLLSFIISSSCFAVVDIKKWGQPQNMTREEIIKRTYVCPPVIERPKDAVSVDTLVGTVTSGYQGWFNAEGDGTGLGWKHYTWHDGFKPGSVSVDFWPDVSEYTDLYDTPFKYPDGTVAKTFSSVDLSTVKTHFKWMRDYGIDGVFMQRFVVDIGYPYSPFKEWMWNANIVLYNARIAANTYGRTFAIAYDMAGMKSEIANTADAIIADWKLLVDEAKITQDKAYMKHDGKFVVQLWAVGVPDTNSSGYTLDDIEKIIDFLHNDPKYGNCFVITGGAADWRTGVGDCISKDDPRFPQLQRIYMKADAIAPWGPGRYNNVEDFNRLLETRYKPDVEWCKKNNKLYLPAVFPGFSWHNMYPDSPRNVVPRLKGDFLWAQYKGFAEIGVTAIYQAMFDEIDEGTAIFKCTNNPPNSDLTGFSDLEGLPSDYYLKLVGEGGKLIRGERKSTEKPVP